MANPFTRPMAYIAVTHDYAPGDQVASADLNAIQEGIVSVSDGLDGLADELNAVASPVVTSSVNLTDTPAPDAGAGWSVWCEIRTNGTTGVTVDVATERDYRDRLIHVQGHFVGDNTHVPGGADEDAIGRAWSGSGDSINQVFYSGPGTTGSTGTYSAESTPASLSDHVRFWVTSSGGGLALKKLTAADSDYTFIGVITASPTQNHQ